MAADFIINVHPFKPTADIKNQLYKGVSMRSSVPKAVIRNELYREVSPYSSVPKAVIRDDLKAGGSIRREFTVEMTSEGVKINVTA